MKKSLLFGFAAAMTLASCTTNDEVMEIAKQQEMSFSAFANKSTKAPISDLTKQEKTFGLFGYKSKIGQTNATVFPNTIVNYTDPTGSETVGTWTPSDIRYWDNTCSYEFFAYAPSDGNIKKLVTCDPATDKMTITGFQVNETVADQKDVLIATKVDRANTTGTNLATGQVNFTFHHILTKVNIQFAKGVGDQKTVLYSISLKNVPTKGDCAVTFNAADAQAPLIPNAVWSLSETPVLKTYTFEMPNNGLTLETNQQTAIADLLMIPQTFTNLSLDVVFTVNGEVFKRTVDLAGINTKWDPNTNLTYQLTILNGSDSANDKIEVGVTEVKDWTTTDSTGNVPN